MVVSVGARSSAAWLVGVLVPVAAISLAPSAWPVGANVVIAVLSAVATGLLVGLLNGRTMRGIFAGRSQAGAGG